MNWRTGRPNKTGRKLCRVPDARHSAKIQTSPSAKLAALGEVWIFAECQASGTLRSLGLCRVSGVWHSAKFETSPSAKVITLGKYVFQEIENGCFAECQGKNTRQSLLFFLYFFCFLCINHILHHKKTYIYSRQVLQYIYGTSIT